MKSYYSIIIFSIFLSNFSLYGQNNTNELYNSLKELSKWHYQDDTDVDSLVISTGKNLTSILKKQSLKHLGSLNNFSTLSSEDSIINIYTFSYNSGGTRGDVNNPVIQWKKDDCSFSSYELFPANKKGYSGIEVDFFEIHKLPSKNKDLYILIGGEKGSSQVFKDFALVIEIKNNFLILDYPAFCKKSSALCYYDNIFSGKSRLKYLEKDNSILISGIGKKDKIKLISAHRNIENISLKNENIKFRFDGNTFIQE